jgi:acyl dehydratase
MPGPATSEFPLIPLGSSAALHALVGAAPQLSDWLTVDQAMIDGFAAVTGDRQWLHVDPERAAVESPYGTTIAHGFLVLSLVSALLLKCFSFPGRKMSVNYGFDRIRFTGPVRSGARIRGEFRVVSVVDVAPNQARIIWDVEVRIKGESRPALVASWLSQMGY